MTNTTKPILLMAIAWLLLPACGSPPVVEEAIEPAPEVCSEACAEGIPCVAGRCGAVVEIRHGFALLNTGEIMGWGTGAWGAYYHAPTVLEGFNGITQIATSRYRLCALDRAGAVYCRDGGEVKKVEGIEDGVKVAVGWGLACALDEGGSLSCWKLAFEENDQPIGPGAGPLNEVAPVFEASLEIVDVVLANAVNHSDSACVLFADGRVKCWGENLSGQLGNESFQSHREPDWVEGLNGVTAIAGAENGFCALRRDGEVLCWGGHRYYPREERPERIEKVLKPVPLTAKATALFGGRLPCALLEDGSSICWKVQGEKNRIESFPLTALDERYQSLYFGQWNEACGLTLGGEVLCWDNSAHEAEYYLGPVELEGLPPIVSLSTEHESTCAKAADGSFWGWGWGGLGEEDPDLAEPVYSPKEIESWSHFESVDMGTWAGCGLAADGEVSCWGHNPREEWGRFLGVEPKPVAKFEGASQITMSDGSACVLLGSGEVECWGGNGGGRLGNGSNEPAAGPVKVVGLEDVVMIDETWLISCALNAAGEVWCWGQNNSWMPEPVEGKARLIPQRVEDLPKAQAIALGLELSCALVEGGDVYCWGNGPLGNGKKGRSARPQQVLIGDVRAIDVGFNHACAIKEDGSLWCWGDGSYGQTGEGMSRWRHKPVQVPGVAGASALALGAWHGCVLLEDASVKCWGNASYGLLGIGELAFSQELKVSGLATQRCGDGARYRGESCDDGNLLNGDGCSAKCELEAGFVCEGNPSRCALEGSGENCAVAIELVSPMQVQGSLAGSHDTINASGFGLPGSSAGNEVVYRLELPAQSQVEVLAESEADLMIYAFEAKGEECPRWVRFLLAGSDVSQRGQESMIIRNATDEPLSSYVVVDTYLESEEDFVLHVGDFQPVTEDPNAAKRPRVYGN